MTPTNFEFHSVISSEHAGPDVDDRGADSWTLPIESASGPLDTYTTASSWRVTVNLEPARRNLCSTCGAHFDRPSALKQHILSHTGEKPHACNMCPSRFSTLSNLRRHQKSCQAIRERQEAKIMVAPTKAGGSRQHRTAARRTLHPIHTSSAPSASPSAPTHTPPSSSIQSQAPYHPPVILNPLSTDHFHSYSTSSSSSGSLPTSPSSSVSNEQPPWLATAKPFHIPQNHAPIQPSNAGFHPPASSLYFPTGFDHEYPYMPLGGQQHLCGDGITVDSRFEMSHNYSNLGHGGESSAYPDLRRGPWPTGALVPDPVWVGSEAAAATMMLPPHSGYFNPQ